MWISLEGASQFFHFPYVYVSPLFCTNGLCIQHMLAIATFLCCQVPMFNCLIRQRYPCTPGHSVTLVTENFVSTIRIHIEHRVDNSRSKESFYSHEKSLLVILLHSPQSCLTNNQRVFYGLVQISTRFLISLLR